MRSPYSAVLVLVGLASVALVAAPVRAATEPGPRCAGSKIKAAGKKAASKLACHAKAVAKGEAVSTDCLLKAESKFATAFSKAEAKGGCVTTGDAAAIEAKVDSFVTNAVAALPDGGTDDGRKCAGSKIKAVGKDASSELGCQAKAVTKGAAVDSACLAKAADKLTAAFGKAESKGGCASSGDSGALLSDVDAFVNDVVAELPSTPPTSTTTSTSTTTTSSTIMNVSLANDVQPILNTHCALPGCHTGVSPAAGMNLSAGQTYAFTVGVASAECPTFARVEPGDPASSYIMFKLQGSGPCFMGSQMPLFSAPLSATQQSIISTWILEGALNN